MSSSLPVVFTSGALRRYPGSNIESEIASILTSSLSSQVDEPVPLPTAIRTCLYQYVFESIIQGHEDVRNGRGSIDYLDPTSEFPEPPPDPKLCFLFKMASSPSIWDMSVTTYDEYDEAEYEPRYNCTFISRIHLEVHKLSLIDRNIPSFGLDVNRHAVLALLYKAISSDKFGDSPVCVKDCCIALIIFLRVLNSTSRRPSFLPEKWCTPGLAAKSVQIAFKDREWKLRFYKPQVVFKEDIQRFTPAAELALYFSPLPSSQTKLLNISLLGTSLTQSQICPIADKLDSQIFRQARDYIFEPQTLFTACALLLVHHDETRARPVL
ncbi:hypothetical protein IW262DRAFT_1465277 [Armillaria fumosa]|nr:hypothetical protein IW262DRAFT_1465277 [Armillaria fumosa]